MLSSRPHRSSTLAKAVFPSLIKGHCFYAPADPPPKKKKKGADDKTTKSSKKKELGQKGGPTGKDYEALIGRNAVTAEMNISLNNQTSTIAPSMHWILYETT